ncbi:hypothetical protein KA001_00680 [Patescibacteria group bacterium]|nr:hypothetical protein [Patescibacteria group bacterium]
MFSKNKLFIFTSFILLIPTIWNLWNRNCDYFTDYLFCSSNPSDFIKYLNFFFLFFIFLGLSFLYYKIISSRHSSESGNLVWKNVLLIVFIFFLISPFGTTDIFYYRGVAQGEIEKQINPYFGGFSKDLEFLNLKFDNLSPVMYPPLFLQINKAIYSFSPTNEILSVYLYKFFSLIVFLFCVYLIKRYFDTQTAILFALNPLLLFEFVTNAHLDIYMILFFVLSIVFLKKQKIVFSVYFVFVATLIKFNAILVLPFYALYFLSISENFKNLLVNCLKISIGAISGLLTIVIFYIPYWKGFETLQGISKQADWSFNTLYERLVFTSLNPFLYLFEGKYNYSSFRDIWLILVFIGFTILALHIVINLPFRNLVSSVFTCLRRQGFQLSADSLYFYSGFLLLLFPTLMMRSFLPWYLSWATIFFIFSHFKYKKVVLFLLSLILAIYYPTVYLIGHFNYFQGQVIYYNSLIIVEWLLFSLITYLLFRSKIKCLKTPLSN